MRVSDWVGVVHFKCNCNRCSAAKVKLNLAGIEGFGNCIGWHLGDIQWLIMRSFKALYGHQVWELRIVVVLLITNKSRM